MSKLELLVLFSVLFPVTHIGLSWSPVRRMLVRVLGEWPFRGVYSLISFVCLGGMILIYRKDPHLGAVLWQVPFWIELVVCLPLMLVAFVLVVSAFATPSPASMAPAAMRARGILRITRHPMNIGFACFGAAHLVANGAVGDVAFFGSFVVLGIVGALHLDRRKLAEKGEAFREFLAATSLVPFAAILRGRNRLEAGEMKWPVLVVALLLFAAFLLLHGKIFGPELVFL